MTKNTLARATASDQSPFDSIRRFDEKGNEYWLGRDLQPMLGYKTWQRFAGAVERAIISCQLLRPEGTELAAALAIC